MTGARLPAGADAVVPVEWTDGGSAQVEIHRPAEPGGAQSATWAATRPRARRC
jgi:molybdopterin molybdotransferase